MSDEPTQSGRPDFEERLRQVKRKQRARAQQAMASNGLDPAGDASGLSPDPAQGLGGSSWGRSAASGGNGSGNGRMTLIGLAVGMSALFLALISAALIFRQGTRIDQLQESITFLEEQLENSASDGGGSQPDAGIAQLNRRMEAVENRLPQLQFAPQGRGKEEGVKWDINRMKRLDEGLVTIKQRLAGLERDVGNLHSASSRAPVKSGGKGAGWYIILASFRDRADAEKVRQRFHKKGLQAQVHPVTVDGMQWFRVRVGPIPTVKAATARGEQLKSEFGLASIWVSR